MLDATAHRLIEQLNAREHVTEVAHMHAHMLGVLVTHEVIPFIQDAPIIIGVCIYDVKVN